MSEQATSERILKRGWARPGGSHDKLIRVLKIGLPALIGVVLAFLFFSPLGEKQEISFLLKKDEVGHAESWARGRAGQTRNTVNAVTVFTVTAIAVMTGLPAARAPASAFAAPPRAHSTCSFFR